MTPPPPPPAPKRSQQSETPFLDGLLDWTTTLHPKQNDHVLSLMADLMLDLANSIPKTNPNNDEQN